MHRFNKKLYWVSYTYQLRSQLKRYNSPDIIEFLAYNNGKSIKETNIIC